MMPMSLRAACSGQPGVAVQRDAVADARQDLRVAHVDVVAGVGRAAQQAVELFELAALALPADPGPLARVPLAHPMEQVEAVGATLAEAGIQVASRRRGRRRGSASSCRHRRPWGVGEVAEDREVNARVDVAQGQDLHVLQQFRHARHAGEQRGDDDHGARVVRDAGLEVEAGETPRRHERARPGAGRARWRARWPGSRSSAAVDGLRASGPRPGAGRRRPPGRARRRRASPIDPR